MSLRCSKSCGSLCHVVVVGSHVLLYGVANEGLGEELGEELADVCTFLHPDSLSLYSVTFRTDSEQFVCLREQNSVCDFDIC